MRPPVRLLLLGLLLAVLVTGGVVVAGTLSADDETMAPEEEEPFATTALEDFDTTGLEVRRTSFCPDVDPRQVEAALGAAAETERAWDNGDRVKVAEGVRDVVHEYGCAYSAGDTAARAWVFAPPVDARRAAQLMKAGQQGGSGQCSGLSGSEFGEPSLSQVCQQAGRNTATVAGLIGDAWLTCQLEVPDPVDDDELADRVGRWCVGVVLAASAEETAEG